MFLMLTLCDNILRDDFNLLLSGVCEFLNITKLCALIPVKNAAEV